MLFNYAASILFISLQWFISLYQDTTTLVPVKNTSVNHHILQNTSQHHLLFAHPKQFDKVRTHNLFIGNTNHAQLTRLTHISIQSKIQLQFGPNISL